MIEVKIKFSDETVDRMNRITGKTREKNRARVLGVSLDLLERIIDEIKDGSEMQVVKSNGERERIDLKGL